MTSVYLGIGTNQGNREAFLAFALAEIGEKIGAIAAQSAVLETEAWGYVSPNKFLNMAVAVETKLPVEQLLQACKAIEQAAGRPAKSRAEGYEDRPLDIDILFYGNEIINTHEIEIPHREIARRRFVLEPLAEIAPEFIHPVLGKTIIELVNISNTDDTD